MPITRIGAMNVDVAIAQTPDGRPAVLLQLPDGYVLMPRAADARTLAQHLIAAADALTNHEGATS